MIRVPYLFNAVSESGARASLHHYRYRTGPRSVITHRNGPRDSEPVRTGRWPADRSGTVSVRDGGRHAWRHPWCACRMRHGAPTAHAARLPAALLVRMELRGMRREVALALGDLAGQGAPPCLAKGRRARRPPSQGPSRALPCPALARDCGFLFTPEQRVDRWGGRGGGILSSAWTAAPLNAAAGARRGLRARGARWAHPDEWHGAGRVRHGAASSGTKAARACVSRPRGRVAPTHYAVRGTRYAGGPRVTRARRSPGATCGPGPAGPTPAAPQTPEPRLGE